MARETWYKDSQEQVQTTSNGKRKGKFQKAGDQNIKTSTVMFIPSTKNGTLIKTLKEAEIEMSRITRFRVRYQEAGGIQLARLFSTDLGKGQPCGREECQPCGRQDDEKIPNCKQSSIVYESSCQICNKDNIRTGQETGRQGIYLGETSRSLFERNREHLKDAADFDEGSHMIKHWLTSHEEEENCPDFKFRIVGNYKDCLSRQVSEAVMIHYSQDFLLNSKNEYNANCLTRLRVDETKFEQKTREKLEAMKEAKEKEAWRLFKSKNAGFRKRKKKDDAPEDITSKRPRLSAGDQESTLPPEEEPGGGQGELVDDLGICLAMMEGVCARAGKLRKQLEKDKLRMIRRMETFEQDRILADIHTILEEIYPPLGGNTGESLPDGKSAQGAGHPITTPHTRDPLAEKGDKMICTGSENENEDNPVPGGRKSEERSTSSEKDSVPCGRKTALKPWCETMVGLVGWWRRVELEASKEDNITRRLEKKATNTTIERKQKKESKLNFLKKYYPNCTTSPGGRMKLSNKNSELLGHPSDIGKHIRTAELSFSPQSKRKAGGGGHLEEFNSPSKRLRFKNNFTFPMLTIIYHR